MSAKFRFIIVLSALLLFGFGQAAYALTGGCPIEGAEPFNIGPVNPNNGFPQFVADSNGLSLELCLDSTPPGSGLPPNCFYDPPDPANPFSAQIGFGAEGFWWAADATILPTDPGALGVDAILVQAVEAAFLTETPANGDQFPFTRLRIRIDVPVAGTYIVTHPYGQETFFVAEGDLGPGNEILESFDIQFAANSVHQGRVGPFLVWDPAVLPLAPVGFVGNGADPHAVTGSPCLTNFFRIQGPGGIDVQTNDFVVQGKLSTNFGLAVDRATYTRSTDLSGSIDVFASSVPDKTLVVDDGIGLTAMLEGIDPVTLLGTGKYFANIPFTTLPAGITVTNVTDDPDTVLAPVLTDLVTINLAQYNTDQLTVAAVSSDAVGPPALTVEGFDVPPGTFAADIPPATVTVSSTAGGSDIQPVVVVVPPAAPDVCAIVVSPLSLPFGSVNVGTTVTLPVNISNAAGTADCIVDLALTSSQEFALNPGSPAPIFTVVAGDAVGKDVLVDYTPADTVADTGTLTIDSNDPNAVDNPIDVALTGTGADACNITVDPLALAFGSVPIGSTATLPVTIGNTGIVDCIVALTVTPAAGEFSAAPTSFIVASGGSQLVNVAYAPLDTVSDTGTLDIASNDPGGPASVTLSGTGLEVGDTLTIAQARFRTGRRRWDVNGTATVPGPGNTVTVSLVSNNPNTNGAVIGIVDVDAAGAWLLRVDNSTVIAVTGDQVLATSTAGGSDTLAVNVRQ